MANVGISYEGSIWRWMFANRINCDEDIFENYPSISKCVEGTGRKVLVSGTIMPCVHFVVEGCYNLLIKCQHNG